MTEHNLKWDEHIINFSDIEKIGAKTVKEFSDILKRGKIYLRLRERSCITDEAWCMLMQLKPTINKSYCEYTLRVSDDVLERAKLISRRSSRAISRLKKDIYQQRRLDLCNNSR